MEDHLNRLVGRQDTFGHLDAVILHRPCAAGPSFVRHEYSDLDAFVADIQVPRALIANGSSATVCVSSCGCYLTTKKFRYYVFGVEMGLPNSIITVTEYMDTSGDNINIKKYSELYSG